MNLACFINTHMTIRSYQTNRLWTDKEKYHKKTKLNFFKLSLNEKVNEDTSTVLIEQRLKLICYM